MGPATLCELGLLAGWGASGPCVLLGSGPQPSTYQPILLKKLDGMDTGQISVKG